MENRNRNAGLAAPHETDSNRSKNQLMQVASQLIVDLAIGPPTRNSTISSRVPVVPVTSRSPSLALLSPLTVAGGPTSSSIAAANAFALKNSGRKRSLYRVVTQAVINALSPGDYVEQVQAVYLCLMIQTINNAAAFLLSRR